jgi:hypothetical protein
VIQDETDTPTPPKVIYLPNWVGVLAGVVVVPYMAMIMYALVSQIFESPEQHYERVRKQLADLMAAPPHGSIADQGAALPDREKNINKLIGQLDQINREWCAQLRSKRIVDLTVDDTERLRSTCDISIPDRRSNDATSRRRPFTGIRSLAQPHVLHVEVHRDG